MPRLWRSGVGCAGGKSGIVDNFGPVDNSAERPARGLENAEGGHPWRVAPFRSAGGGQELNGPSSGRRRSGLSSSSTLTSLNVITRTFFTNRAGRYMSHTQASDIRTSK
ncbi:hypothetical protein DFJ66_6349 [Saccharothrix variisporea]|uniref:Uncharacterized protein n=1 Tax=Saccharothrix variisporea TaxID=543527 RepID=A0A495XKS8_9PSEU|nr:hypothetical protein DFJ66_6349 [Saccharothrix variisporea]